MSRLFSVRRAPTTDRSAPTPYIGEELVGLSCDAGRLWLPKSDGVIRPFIEARGTWEPEEGELLRRFFKPGLRFLDVGANVGYFSLLVGKHCPRATIHAFEPHPQTSQILALNAWASGYDITTYAMALSDGSQRLLTLTTAEHNLGDTRTAGGSSGTMLSPAAALDEVLPDEEFDLVKIDVQGFEPEVIGGMAGMLRRSPDVTIVSEFWPAALRDRDLDPVGVLKAYAGLGLSLRVQVEREIRDLSPVETVRVCDSAGVVGQVNLLMTRKS